MSQTTIERDQQTFVTKDEKEKKTFVEPKLTKQGDFVELTGFVGSFVP